MANAKRIMTEVIEAGRIRNSPGPFYDRLFFILEDKIVQMPTYIHDKFHLDDKILYVPVQ